MSRPLYQQVKSKILHKIASLSANSSIPSERALSLEFEVSRMTVRKAIDELVDEGILYRDKTRGTFVSDKELVRKNTIDDEKENETCHLLYMTHRTFEEIAPILNVPIYEDIMRIVGSRQRAGEIANIDEIYMTSAYYRRDEEDIEEVFELIERKKDFRITKTFIPMLIPVQFVNIMNIPMDVPIIMVKSIYRSFNGETILMRKTYYNPFVETIEISN